MFQRIWKTIGDNIAKYHTYPRIVGETGGKDFDKLAHPSAEADAVAVGLVRGAFLSFRAKNISAASRAYIPQSMWPAVKAKMLADLASMTMGTTEDFRNFINAVIDEKAFDKITSYIADAKKSPGVQVIAGGNYDKSGGLLYRTNGPRSI